jgi:hypothetical protein
MTATPNQDQVAEVAREAPPQAGGPDCTLPAHLRWNGPGPMPPRWTADDGTIVYRSYEDYCDD